jgi:hypothetical protein
MLSATQLYSFEADFLKTPATERLAGETGGPARGRPGMPWSSSLVLGWAMPPVCPSELLFGNSKGEHFV